MTKEHLTHTLAKQLKITQEEAYNRVIIILEVIKQGLSKEGKVTIRGFGCFSTRNKSKRIGRNPKTGEPAVIKARRVVKFKAYDSLKIEVNH
tara:strand:- start:841 stop:1116 length:276 start_codon:yes stop_codon:yes gene_type:complete